MDITSGGRGKPVPGVCCRRSFYEVCALPQEESQESHLVAGPDEWRAFGPLSEVKTSAAL